jgi:hypothetical protein
VHQGHHDDAQVTVGLANSDGDMDHPVSVAVFKEVVDTIEWEKNVGKTLSPLEMFRSAVSRRRLLIGASPGVLTSSTGNIIGEFELDCANKQLRIILGRN